jgi:hypothetical protein
MTLLQHQSTKWEETKASDTMKNTASVVFTFPGAAAPVTIPRSRKSGAVLINICSLGVRLGRVSQLDKQYPEKKLSQE